MRDDLLDGCLGGSRVPGVICGSRYTRNAKGGQTPSKPVAPVLTEPRLHSGNLGIEINKPRSTGPTHANYGAYDVIPEIDIQFEGTVILPEGFWEIGLLQFIWNDRIRIMYSEGGEEYWEHTDIPNALDNDDVTKDIFFKGTRSFLNLSKPFNREQFSLRTSDRPGIKNLVGIKKRCNDTIVETLVWAERTFLAFAVLACRKNGKGGPFFPVLATQLYGFYWYLTPAAVEPNVEWRKIPHTGTVGTERPPFQGPARHGLPLDGKLANDIGEELQKTAEQRFKVDCGKRLPKDSIELPHWVH